VPVIYAILVWNLKIVKWDTVKSMAKETSPRSSDPMCHLPGAQPVGAEG
jgi:hypothetical protein